MSYHYRQILYVCCLTSFITITFAFGRYIFAMITPDIAQNLNVDYEFIGRINAGHQFSYLLFSLIGGLASGVIGARLLISASVVFCALSLISLYFVTNPWILLITVALQGIFAATSWIPMVELIARSITEENRGKSLGVISSGTSYGLIVNSALIPYIIAAYHWQTVWLVFGVISFFVGLLGVYIVYSAKELDGLPATDADAIRIENNASGALGKQHYGQPLLLVLLLVVSGLYLIPFQSYIVPFMREDLGLDHTITGISWALFGSLGLISGLGAGVLADRLSAKKAMIVTYGLSAAAILVLLVSSHVYSVLLACALFGLAYNGIFGLHPTYVSKMLPPNKTAKLFGLLNLALGFGSMVGNYGGGYIKNVSGSFGNAYVVMAILSLLAVCICFLIQDDKARGLS